jgi:hypothetical protein
MLEVLSIRFPSVALQGKAAFHAVPSEREGDSALTVCRGRGKRNAFMGYYVYSEREVFQVVESHVL